MKDHAMILSSQELLELHKLLCRTGALNLAITHLRREVFGACLLGTLMETVSVVPMFALLKKGILFESDVSGDHRTNWGVLTVKDEVTRPINGHDHIREIFRNHFNRATGGNRGRDGNIHLGCLDCNIVPFMYSDMGGMTGIMAGRAEKLARQWHDLPRKQRPIAVSFYGEGAEQQGLLHETRNAVAVSNFKWDLEEFSKRYGEQFITPLMRELKVSRGAPTLYIIVLNHRSLFADAIEEYANSDLVKRALGYGDMVGVQVNSFDVLKYYAECEKAIERAQECVATLMVVDTYRGTGHNQEQIQYEKALSDIATREDLARVKRVWGVYDLSEFHAAWKKDPILYPNYILATETANKETLDRIRVQEERNVLALAAEVLKEPPITVLEDKKDRNIFPPIDLALLPKEPSAASLLKTDPGNTRLVIARQAREMGYVLDGSKANKWGYNEAYTRTVKQLMRDDKMVIYYGEDVGSREGGVLSLTRARGDISLAEEFGPGRVPNFPISEEAGLSMVAGHALNGPKGFWENQFGWFFADSYRVMDGTGPQYYQKKMKFRYIAVFPCGKVHGGGSGDFHERYVEEIIQTMGGIAILFPSNAYDLVGLLRTAYLYDGPVALILEISASNSSEFAHLARNWATDEIDLTMPQGVPIEPYAIPFGTARIVRPGKDFTVVAYGACAVAAAKNEADFLYKEEEIDAEVIDLRTVHPFDIEAVKFSVVKTGRMVVMQSANEFRGAGHYIQSKLIEEDDIFWNLLSKPKLIYAGMEGDIFVPTAKTLLEARLPWQEIEVSVFDLESRKDAENEQKYYTQRIHRSHQLAECILAGMKDR